MPMGAESPLASTAESRFTPLLRRLPEAEYDRPVGSTIAPQPGTAASPPDTIRYGLSTEPRTQPSLQPSAARYEAGAPISVSRAAPRPQTERSVSNDQPPRYGLYLQRDAEPSFQRNHAGGPPPTRIPGLTAIQIFLDRRS